MQSLPMTSSWELLVVNFLGPKGIAKRLEFGFRVWGLGYPKP